MKRKLLRPIAIALMAALALSLTVIPLTAAAAEVEGTYKFQTGQSVPFTLSFTETNPGESAVWLYARPLAEREVNHFSHKNQLALYIVNSANIASITIEHTSQNVEKIDTTTAGMADERTLTATLNDKVNVSGKELTITGPANFAALIDATGSTGPEDFGCAVAFKADGTEYILFLNEYAGVHYSITNSGGGTVTQGANARVNNQFSVFASEQTITVTPRAGGSIKSFTVNGDDEFSGLAINEDTGVGTVTLPYAGASDNLLYTIAVEFVSPPAPPPTSSAPAAPSMPWTDPEPNTPDSFLASLYFAALGRTPDEGGFDDWADALESGAMTATDVVYGFVFSPEMVTKNLSDEEYVVMLYAAFFARDPDEGGKAHWLGRLASGASRYDVFLGFANSVEFDVFCDAHGFVRI
ncbi:MAG: DUF4214 domain-containing protein [Oscillospiraceae bacterium]|nr:DUF4214 domain-containing protein [Oscillospiraceae bacterium]